jgi:hypothetical protein
MAIFKAPQRSFLQKVGLQKREKTLLQSIGLQDQDEPTWIEQAPEDAKRTAEALAKKAAKNAAKEVLRGVSDAFFKSLLK